MHTVSGAVLHWETQQNGVCGDLLQRCPEDLCYYSNEGASKHYGLLDKSFACDQSQKPDNCREVPGHCKKKL